MESNNLRSVRFTNDELEWIELGLNELIEIHKKTKPIIDKNYYNEIKKLHHKIKMIRLSNDIKS